MKGCQTCHSVFKIKHDSGRFRFLLALKDFFGNNVFCLQKKKTFFDFLGPQWEITRDSKKTTWRQRVFSFVKRLPKWVKREGKQLERVQIVRPLALAYKREGKQFERVQIVRPLALAYKREG